MEPKVYYSILASAFRAQLVAVVVVVMVLRIVGRLHTFFFLNSFLRLPLGFIRFRV